MIGAHERPTNVEEQVKEVKSKGMGCVHYVYPRAVLAVSQDFTLCHFARERFGRHRS